MEQVEFTLPNNRNLELEGLGSIIQPKWSSLKAELTAGSSHYNLEPRGFWGTRFELLQNGRVMYEVKAGFWGKVTVTPLHEAHHFYTITYGKGFNKGYRLLDYKGEEVATVTSGMRKWKTFYTLSTIPGFTDTDQGKLLALLLVRNYRGAQQAAVAAGTTHIAG
ncbi:hypothetical protein AM493_07440 [Flavobacterium akiainvivens]|uniref:Uncharacterized protein n=1 Tax=Flavobacterium akiainvivens TaxID=1202724 RepID=A0A0M8MHH7_9FLAO|nr:hypothetical protein [Flavobacterium akiainvivens]KOS05887.1 hypothetical protein AM493_07440 [Flavobacterium akiainvivens]SFQ56236.1 hypothetical protein SAMN05444144_10829 [Flavobacterium akiainvivens]